MIFVLVSTFNFCPHHIPQSSKHRHQGAGVCQRQMFESAGLGFLAQNFLGKELALKEGIEK